MSSNTVTHALKSVRYYEKTELGNGYFRYVVFGLESGEISQLSLTPEGGQYRGLAYFLFGRSSYIVDQAAGFMLEEHLATWNYRQRRALGMSPVLGR